MSRWIEHRALIIGVKENTAAWQAAVEGAFFSARIETLYKKFKVLSAGAFGVVMSAERVPDNTKVAVKMIKGGSVAEANALLEVRILIYLQQVEGAGGCRADITCYHKHFRARIGDALQTEIAKRDANVTTNGEYFFIETRFEPGNTLKHMMKEEHLDGHQRSFAWNVEMMWSLSNAARFLHEHGVYHRDFKPENIIINNAGASQLPQGVILDVGVACVETQCGTALAGSTHYLPPNAAPLLKPGANYVIEPTARAKFDVYALAATFYEWMTQTEMSGPTADRPIPPYLEPGQKPTTTLYRVKEDDKIWEIIAKALITVIQKPATATGPMEEFAYAFRALRPSIAPPTKLPPPPASATMPPKPVARPTTKKALPSVPQK